MKLLLAGTSGAIGTALSQALSRSGHSLRHLVRREPRSADEIRWAPGRGELDPAALDGIDVVVCLSGAGVAEKRWTDEYKQTLRSSRIDTVTTIARSIAAREQRPSALVCASAVGYYGDAGATPLDERSPAGDTFLARLCVDWEAAANPARDAGVAVAHLRTGLVLDRSTGLLARLTPLFKLGLGGKIGSGEQYWPWISLADEVAAIAFIIENGISGPVNLSGPAPATCAQFAATLARTVHRPALLPVPGFALRIALGQFADDVLTGQNAFPQRLLDAGFVFQHSTLEAALAAELS